jgi:hypothetical protein
MTWEPKPQRTIGNFLRAIHYSFYHEHTGMYLDKTLGVYGHSRGDVNYPNTTNIPQPKHRYFGAAAGAAGDDLPTQR